MLLISLIICLVWYVREKSSGLREVFIGSIAGAALLSGGIYFYQHYTANVINYYSIKLGFITLVILLVFALPVLILALWRHLSDTSALIYLAFIVCLCVFLPQALLLNLSHITFAAGTSRLLSPYSASQIVKEYPSVFTHNTVVVVFKQLNYEEDLITTNFLRTVARSTDPCQAHEVADLLIGKHDALHSEILKCSQQHPKQKIIIVASSLNYDSLQQQFSSLPNVRVLLSN